MKKDYGIFNDMSEECRSRLLDAGVQIKKKKGEEIFSEREAAEYVAIVLDGYAALYRSCHYGDKKVVFICAEGEMLNEEVIEKAQTASGAKTLSEVTLLIIRRDAFIELMRRDFELVQKVYTSMSRKNRRLFHLVGNANGTYPVEKHLAAKIWKLARDYGTDMENGKEIPFEVTVSFLAEMVGAKRETVSRAVSKLKKGGFITHENGILSVPNLEKIREVV